MLTRGDKGQAVVELQERLLALGYALPRWGADGDLGSETLDALTRFLVDHGDGYADLDAGAVSDWELGHVQKIFNALSWPVPVPGKVFYDLRREASRKAVGGRRPWTKITGICLHQTACDFGAESPRRWDTLGAHIGASREGNVFWVHDLEFVVYHGNELNGFTVGLECEGNYPGLDGDTSTVWQPGGGALMTVTPELAKAAQEAIRWICATVARHGGKVVHLFAHRQTAGSRRADPGEEIWKQVALPIMAELSLDDGGPKFRIDNGRPIPEAWNPEYRGNAY